MEWKFWKGTICGTKLECFSLNFIANKRSSALKNALLCTAVTIIFTFENAIFKQLPSLRIFSTSPT